MLIKSLRLFVDGVDDDRANAGNVSGLYDPGDGVPQCRGADSLTLPGAINGEAPNDHDRQWVRHVAAHAAWRVRVCYTASG